ncbi:MAG: PDDEXK nuclease domain-containing protein [Paludibacteraceae bacterium]|nr:PDDEXK nuclease domain-containing protein [Paludibacteraceae bacterium]
MNDKIVITQESSSLSSNETMFAEVIGMIQTTRQNVIRVANTALIDLYWKVGEYLSRKIANAEWGDGVVRQLADHISRNCPDIKGFSDKNLWRMKQFYETYAEDAEKLSTLLRQISWSHNRLIMSRCKSAAERRFYLEKACSEHYSFRQLDRQIDSALYERTQVSQPKLSPLLREIAPEAERVFRDQYVMEFITGKEAKPENNLRRALLKKMKQFILELGKDFICIEEEYRLQVGCSDFRIDLLFYHRELQCLVAFELKTEKFKPEHLGQLNFYLEALDRDVKKAKENPSIGVLLCKDKDDEVVEYALSRSLSPTMVAEYQLCLPDKALLQQKMRELEEELDAQER